VANLPHSSRRAALLASVAGLAIAGASWDAMAQNIVYTNSTANPAQATTGFPLLNGDTLINTGSGSISILSTASGSQPAVAVSALGVGLIQNTGTILSAQDPGGIGIGVNTLSSIGTIDNRLVGSIAINSVSGTIAATGGNGNAIQTLGGIATLLNGGTIRATGTGGSGIFVGTSGSIGAITNDFGGTIIGDRSAVSNLGTIGQLANGNDGVIQGVTRAIDVRSGGTFVELENRTGGTIVATGSAGVAISNAGTILTLTNFEIISANGSSGIGVNVIGGGRIGNLLIGLGSSIMAIGNLGSAIAVGGNGTGNIDVLTNEGRISAGDVGGRGIAVGTGGTVGLLTNRQSGSISAGPDGAGIRVIGGTVTALTNDGLITSNYQLGSGIVIDSGGVVGTLTNSATGTISTSSGDSPALDIGASGASTITTLANSGVILGGGGAAAYAVHVGNGSTIGTITNNAGGTIDGAAGGLVIGFANIGTLSNAGLIQGGPFGIAIWGPLTTLNNQVGGTIASTAADTFFVGQSFGIKVQGTVGVITNNGLITGFDGAIGLQPASTIASLINNGTLLSTTGTAIKISGSATITGGISNSASGLIQGGPSDGSGTAIDASNSTNATTITTAGTIIGAIKQGTTTDVLNVTGGIITGAVVGQTGSGGQVNFNLGSGGSFVTGGSITNVSTVNVNSGMLTVAALSGNAISGASLFRIASGATAALNGNVAATLTSNSGFVNVGTNTISVSGNFTQTSTGQLGVSVAGSAFGSLNVSGTANFASTGAGLALHFLGSSALTSMTVVTSGGLTVSPTQTVSSDSADPWLQNPVASTVGNNVVVTFTAPSLNQIDTAYNTIVAPTPAPLAGTDLTNQNQAINGVRQLLDSLAGNRQTGQALLNALNALTPRQLTQFFQQVQPSMLGSAQSLLATALNNNGGLTASVGDRVTALRETVGMAAGDEPGRGFTVWATPTMKGFTQGQKEGISGFSATSYGAAFGADTLVRPDTRVGLALGLTQTDISFSGPLSGNRNTALTAQAGIYATWFQNDFFLDGAAGFGYSWYNTKEHIGGFGVTRNGDFGGVQFNAKIAAGYDWRVQGAVITPSIGFQEVHLDIDPHATSGGGVFDLNVAGQHIDVAQMKLGSRFSYPITRSNGWTFTPELHGYYVRNLITSRIVTSASFLAGGTFTSTAPARDTDVADLGLGLTIAQKGPFALSAAYDYSFGQTTKDNTFYLRVKTEF